MLRLDLAGGKLAFDRQGLGHAQRRITGEGTDLQDAPRAGQAHEHGEQGALERSDEHLGIVTVSLGVPFEFTQQLIARGGVAQAVLLDFSGNYRFHGWLPRPPTALLLSNKNRWARCHSPDPWRIWVRNRTNHSARGYRR